jgi:Domain of unknown function (DUF4389)
LHQERTMTDSETGPRVLPEPGAAPTGNLWMRGLMMLIVAILIGLAQTILHVLTVLQFVLMLIDKGKPNAQIAGFGRTMGGWLVKAAAFQTAASEDKPWPFSKAD